MPMGPTQDSLGVGPASEILRAQETMGWCPVVGNWQKLIREDLAEFTRRDPSENMFCFVFLQSN